MAAILLAPGEIPYSIPGSPANFDLLPYQASDQQAIGPVVARVSFTDKQDLDRLAQYLDIWSVDEASHTLVAQLTPLQQNMLLAEGRQVIVDPELTAGLGHPHQALEGQTTGIPGYPCYRTVEETYASLAQIAQNHPELAGWIDIGNSWDKITAGGPAGYDLRILQLTNHKIPGPKPIFFLMGAIHAREYATAELATRFAEYLVNAYRKDADITWLLDYNEVEILPVANPDGRKLAETGLLWRKNTDNSDGCSAAYDYGIDLNRNYDFKWGGPGASPDPCNEVYLGRSAASEPETQALQTYLSKLYPDRRGPADGDAAPADTSGLLISLHSFGQLVLWPWGWTSAAAPNAAQMQTLGRKFAFFNHAIPEQADTLYATSGTTDEWLYGQLGTAAYTFEIGNAFFQACSTFESSLYPDNLQALVYAFKAARRPYQTPAGPDILNIQFPANVVTAGAVISFTATADDTRYSGGEASQSIAGARYSIDAPSWISSTQTAALQAADGNLDQPIENLQGSLDTGTLTPGRHLLLIESQDSAGNWGPPSAQFFYLLDPTENPHLEGRVHSAVDNQPLAATIQAGPFNTQSDPATGYYTHDSARRQLSCQRLGSGLCDSRGRQPDDWIKRRFHAGFYAVSGLFPGEQCGRGWPSGLDRSGRLGDHTRTGAQPIACLDGQPRRVLSGQPGCQLDQSHYQAKWDAGRSIKLLAKIYHRSQLRFRQGRIFDRRGHHLDPRGYVQRAIPGMVAGQPGNPGIGWAAASTHPLQVNFRWGG